MWGKSFALGLLIIESVIACGTKFQFGHNGRSTLLLVLHCEEENILWVSFAADLSHVVIPESKTVYWLMRSLESFVLSFFGFIVTYSK